MASKKAPKGGWQRSHWPRAGEGKVVAVWNCVRYGNWWTLAALEDSTGYPQASISARLRDFRKVRFGEHTVEREYRGDGVYAYRVVVNDGRD